MVQRRSHGPYIWATTLAKLLTGENSCEWAGWFKAHHQTGPSRPRTSTPLPRCWNTLRSSTTKGQHGSG